MRPSRRMRAAPISSFETPRSAPAFAKTKRPVCAATLLSMRSLVRCRYKHVCLGLVALTRMLLTVIACRRPPRAVGMPRAFSASTIAPSDLAPARSTESGADEPSRVDIELAHFGVGPLIQDWRGPLLEVCFALWRAGLAWPACRSAGRKIHGIDRHYPA